MAQRHFLSLKDWSRDELELLFERWSTGAAGGDDAELAAGLDGEGLLHAGKTAGDGFELFHPLDVPLK